MVTLTPTYRLGSLDLTQYPFSVAYGEDDRGAPEVVVERVLSSLRAGSLVFHSEIGNRTVTLPVWIEGESLLEIAQAEALLVAEVERDRNEFTFNPGDGTAVDSVYDTFRGQLDADDAVGPRESALIRRYVLTFEAYPYPRSAEKSTWFSVSSPSTSPTTSTIDDCSSTAGFSRVGGAVVTWNADSGYIYAEAPTTNPNFGTILRRSGSVAGNSFIMVTWRATGFPHMSKAQLGLAPAGDTFFDLVAEMANPDGTTTSWFSADGSHAGLDLWFSVSLGVPQGGVRLELHDISGTTSLPGIGSPRQFVFTVTPGGSVPTEGDLVVGDDENDGIEHLIVFSHPLYNGYVPSLRDFMTEGDTPVVDTKTIYGSSVDISTAAFRAQVPVTSLPPGEHHLYARLHAGTATTERIHWSVKAIMLGDEVGDSQLGSVDVTWDGGGHLFVPLGRVHMPPSRMGPTGLVQISIVRDSGGSETVTLDEMWTFARDLGRLTIVQTNGLGGGRGGDISHVQISAPTLENENGALFVYTPDTVFDRTSEDHYTPPSSNVLVGEVDHMFDPAGTQLYVSVMSNDATAWFQYYKRWLHHAAE